MSLSLSLAAVAAPSSSIVPFVGVSVVCGLLVGLSVLVLLSRGDDVSRRVGGFVSPRARRSAATKSLIERALGDKQARAIARSPFLEKVRTELEVAELNLSPEQLLIITVIATLAVGWVLETGTHSIIGMLLAVSVPFCANLLVRMMAAKHRRRFAEQLPDNLQVIASAMRAGQTFIGAMGAVVEDAPEPSKRELRRAVTDEALGASLPEALGQVTERMKSEDFQHVAVVAALQRETGGNTAEVIDLVADTVRERIEIRRMVRSLTAQGRLAGIVLSLLPVGLLVIISLLNPAYTHPLFHTTIGLVALGIGIGCTAAGSFAINKIVNIKI
jgi:tight adherence protein B